VVRRGTLARYAAPLAFLAAVTVAVLLVRAGLDRAPGEPPPTVPTTAVSQPQVGPRFYRIRPGDTLEALAPRFRTTVARLRALNPGLDPAALRVGRRIRVR